MPAFIASLPPDDVVWGVFKVVGCDDRGNLVSRRSKFIFVKYIPDSSPNMRRAKAGGHKGVIKGIFPSTAIDIEVSFPYLYVFAVDLNIFCPDRLCERPDRRRYHRETTCIRRRSPANQL